MDKGIKGQAKPNHRSPSPITSSKPDIDVGVSKVSGDAVLKNLYAAETDSLMVEAAGS